MTQNGDTSQKKSARHTPGPWEVTAGSKYRVKSANIMRGDQVAEFGRYICDTANNQKTRTPENEANARLIAAAPELLKELKHLVSLLEPKEQDGSLHVPGLATLNGALAAIAKAEKP